MKILTAALILFPSQGTFSTPDNAIVGSGFESYSLKILGSEYVFEGEGKTCTLSSLGTGIELSARQISGTSAKAKPTSYLRQALASGNAVFNLDSSVSDQFLNRKSATTSRATVTADQFAYKGSNSEGMLTIPSAFKLNQRSMGSLPPSDSEGAGEAKYRQTFEANGSRATFLVDPIAKDANRRIKSGAVEGPIKFKFVRTVLQVGKDPDTTTLDGVANRMSIDFTGPQGKIVMSGAVVVDAQGTFTAHAEQDEVTISFDAFMQPIGIVATGNPVHDRVPILGGKG